MAGCQRDGRAADGRRRDFAASGGAAAPHAGGIR